MKIVEIRKIKGDLYGVLLDNGKMINMSVDVLPELDGMLMFTAVFPTGWIMTGEAGGFYGDNSNVTINPVICPNTGPLDGVYEIADSVRVLGDYIAATVDAIHDIINDIHPSALDEH